jgi:ankyrin repeat protein
MAKFGRIGFVCAAVAAVVFSATILHAEDGDADREQRSGQLIFNGLRMSNQAGSPSAYLIAKWRRMGTTSAGVGYREQQLLREDGVRFVISPGVVYLNEKGMAMTLDETAAGLLAKPFGSDRQTGATVYLMTDDRDNPDRILYMCRRGNVQLYMIIDRSDEDGEEMTRRSIHRWRFLVKEAERLEIFEPANPPQFVVKVWDEYLGEWQALPGGQAFSRRLAKLHEEESLLLEIDVESEMIAATQPYEFEIRVQKGEKFLQLRDVDDRTALADPDRDGWNEVRVDPVDGQHPPRRLYAHFGAEPEGSSERAQEAEFGVRYADKSGAAEQASGLRRTIPTIMVTAFELRPAQLSASFEIFSSLLTEEEREGLRSSQVDPGTWFNGVFDSKQDMLSSWGPCTDADSGCDPYGLWGRVTVSDDGRSPYGPRSMFETTYLGWAWDLRDNSTSTGFLVMEDRPDGPLEVGPLLRNESVSLYFDISLQEVHEDVEGQGGGYRSLRELVEYELELRDRLEIGRPQGHGCPFEISIWHVDDLQDLKDENGRIRSLSSQDFERIKRGLRKPTGERVTQAGGRFGDLFTFRAGHSRSINSWFPLSLDTLGVPTPFGEMEGLPPYWKLDLEAGIYELRARIMVRLKELEEGEEYADSFEEHVALRFWVVDLPAAGGRTVIQGIETERVDGPPSQRFRLEEADVELHSAARSGDLDALEEAIRAGADVNAPDENGTVPLGWATSLGHREVVRMLLQAGAEVDHQTPRGQSALNVAASRDDRAMVRLLLEAGADVNERIQGATAPEYLKGATPIFLAALHGEGEALDELVQAGADVNARNAGGATILHLATDRGHAPVVRRLLQAGADPNRVDQRGVTPLMSAANAGSAECLWLMIEAGADPNVATSPFTPGPLGGITALMAAAQGGHETTTLALLLSGAKPDVRSVEGKSALDFARDGGHSKVVEILLRPEQVKALAATVFVEELEDALRDGRWDYVKLMIDGGVDVNVPDENGIPLLLSAAERGEVEIVKGLITAGAKIDVRDQEYGTTALIEAAMEGHAEIVRLLIQAGADPNLAARGDAGGEGAGWTALMGAAVAGKPEIVRMLLAEGADRSIVNAKGQTALDMAREEGQGNTARVIQLLGGR